MLPHDVAGFPDGDLPWEPYTDSGHARRRKRRNKRDDRDGESRASRAWRKRRSELCDTESEWDYEDDEPTSPGRVPELPAPVTRTALGVPLEETEACAAMWLAVIATAVEDLEELNHLDRLSRRTKHEQEKSRLLLAGAPAEFFEGPRFREVCEMLGLEPGWVWNEYNLSRFGLDKCWTEKTQRGVVS